jgi:uncharacterized protein YcfJ
MSPSQRISGTRLVIALAAAAASTPLLAGPPPWARNAEVFRDHARVVSVHPKVERVHAPRLVCRTVTVPGHRRELHHGDGAGAVIGGIAGGLIGSQFGRGDGRVASAAVGAIAGTLIGHHAGRSSGHEVIHDREEQRCHRVDDWQERIVGYRVTYEYGGRFHTTELPHDPGARLPVRVSVSPSWGGLHGD